jgi:tetratricopeptide (TPR) repeat protein
MRRLLRSVLGTTATAGEGVAQVLTEAVAKQAPELREWLPLLAGVLDVTVASTESVERLEQRFRRNQLHQVVGRLLAALCPAPTVFVIEDTHWIDDATRDLLADVAIAYPDRPWLLLLTHSEVAAVPVSDEQTVIELQPLTDGAARELAASALGDDDLKQQDIHALIERAGGNPLFLRELTMLMRSGKDASELPGTVDALLNAQVDRLPGHARRVLRFASVVGSTFQASLLQESLGDIIEGSVAKACESLSDFLQHEGRGSFRFRHALIRETAYNGLPFRLRLELHDRLGTSIEGRHGAPVEDRAELLSMHFHYARNYEKAFRYSAVAAERARRKAANVEAATFYRRALDASRRIETTSPDAKARLYESLADVSELAADYDEASAALSQARKLNPEPAASHRLLRKEGVIRERLGQYTQALRWYGRALRHADGAAVSDILALQLAYAGVRFRQGDYADCARRCLVVIAEAQGHGDQASLAHAYYLLDHAYTMLGSSKAGEYRQLALPIFEQLQDFVGQANVLNNLGVSATIDGDWDEGLAYFERSRAARERVGDIVGAATATNNIGEVLLDRGDLAGAESRFREALRTWRGAKYAVGIAVATSALGLAAARGGRFEEALHLLTEARARFEAIHAESFVIETDARLAELYLASGDARSAEAAIDGVFATADAGELGALTAALYRLRGLTQIEQGAWEEAATSLAESTRLGRELGADYELALSLRVRALIAAHTQEDPEPYLRESALIAEKLRLSSMPLIDTISARFS